MRNFLSTVATFAPSDDNAGNVPAPADQPRNGPALGDNRPGNVNADKPASKPRKPRAAKAAKPTTKQAAERYSHASVIPDVSCGYTGDSKPIRKRSAVRIMLTGVCSKLTDRTRFAFLRFRTAYGNKPFLAANLDAGIARQLIALGFLAHHSGGVVAIDRDNGETYVTGDDTKLNFTKAGIAYGTVPAKRAKA